MATKINISLPLRASVQLSRSVVSNSVTPWTAARQTSLSITNSWSLLKLMSIGQWCHLTLSSSVIPFSSCLQSLRASGSFPMSRFFASGGQSFSFSISPCNEYPGLISFRIDWLDPLVVQGALKSLLNTAIQIITSSVLSFLYARVQLSHLYMSTVKTTALNRWIFVGNVSVFQ